MAAPPISPSAKPSNRGPHPVKKCFLMNIPIKPSKSSSMLMLCASHPVNPSPIPIPSCGFSHRPTISLWLWIDLYHVCIHQPAIEQRNPARETRNQRRGNQHGVIHRFSFSLDEEDLAFTRANGSKGIEPGAFQVWIAPNSQSGLQGEFRLLSWQTMPA